MLRIRAAQVLVFEDHVFMPRYEATPLARVREFHATATSIDETTLMDQIRPCAARTRQHDASDAVAWMDISTVLDDDFDRATHTLAILEGAAASRTCRILPC